MTRPKAEPYDNEIPIGKRRPYYRFWELMPAIMSYGMIAILFVLSFISPILGAVYILLIASTFLTRAIVIARDIIRGHNALMRAHRVDWDSRLDDLEHADKSINRLTDHPSAAYQSDLHLENLRFMAESPEFFPKPSETYNVAIIATYNEEFEILDATFNSIIQTTYDKKHLLIVIAYEERGGAAIEATVNKISAKYKRHFYDLLLIKHPDGLPNEVVGKGGNLTYAGRHLSKYVAKQGWKTENIIVTTLDADNRPEPNYFSHLTYEFIVRDYRHHCSFQPITLFTNNIWDAPAPTRVLALGNSFWSIVNSIRSHMIRNFASHAQPLSALEAMDFWSVRTIVEDGHQYWRSYFYFKGDYIVVPLHATVGQDAVLSHSFLRTLYAQFKQLRRWAYGVSDTPFVATRLFTTKKHRRAPFFKTLAKFWRAMDGYINWASASVLVALGGFIPLWVNQQARVSFEAQTLPNVLSIIQTVALAGLAVTIILSVKMLPKMPSHYHKFRYFFMVIQWALVPITAMTYMTLSAFYAQTRLFFGRYMEQFDVTEKAFVKPPRPPKPAKPNPIKPKPAATK
ncbi:glycosyltransferase family 2 protein [Candidatus Saccharibacteria bacterium]|nr:glycosyltransferase family 2 protein [Candidatus Saccharibacteria bacterium]